MSAETLPTVEIDGERTSGLISYRLTTPNKRALIVSIWPDPDFGYYGRRLAKTFLSNLDETEKVPGSTTALYMRARELIEDAATEVGEDIPYFFSVLRDMAKERSRERSKAGARRVGQNPSFFDVFNGENLAAWGRTTGNAIFNWNETYVGRLPSDTVVFAASTIIKPRKR